MDDDNDIIFWNQHYKLCEAMKIAEPEKISNNDVIKKVQEMRERLENYEKS